MDIELVNGLWWPTSPDPREIRRREKRIRDAAVAADAIAQLTRNWGTVIQAGGHVGLWPLLLAEAFTRVVTFEADPVNFACLVRNVDQGGSGNIITHHAALSDAPGVGRVVRTRAHQHLSGAGHVVGPARGDGHEVVCVRIDDAVSGPVGAVVLDVEGGEYRALVGAVTTLSRDAPLVVVEADVAFAGVREGVRSLAFIARYLAPLGYGPPQRFPLGAHNFYFTRPA